MGGILLTDLVLGLVVVVGLGAILLVIAFVWLVSLQRAVDQLDTLLGRHQRKDS